MAHELSQRQLRVGQEIRKVIATALEKGEVRSPEIAEAFYYNHASDYVAGFEVCHSLFDDPERQKSGSDFGTAEC